MPKTDTVRADTGKLQTLASTAEVAAVLGLPEHTLDVWRSKGKGPAYCKVGRHVRYRWAAVDEWISGQEIRTAEAV